MKLYTYFMAVQTARDGIDKFDWYADKDFASRKFDQYLNMRSGLIKRMERIELEVQNLRDSLELVWDDKNNW